MCVFGLLICVPVSKVNSSGGSSSQTAACSHLLVFCFGFRSSISQMHFTRQVYASILFEIFVIIAHRARFVLVLAMLCFCSLARCGGSGCNAGRKVVARFGTGSHNAGREIRGFAHNCRRRNNSWKFNSIVLDSPMSLQTGNCCTALTTSHQWAFELILGVIFLFFLLEVSSNTNVHLIAHVFINRLPKNSVGHGDSSGFRPLLGFICTSRFLHAFK